LLIDDFDNEGMESYYKCLTCKQCFDDLFEVKFHQDQPTCKYFCERCRRQLDTKLATVIHIIEHNMDDKPENEHKQCFLEFYNLDEYEQHQKSCLRETAVTNSSDSNLRLKHDHTPETKGHLKIPDSDNILENATRQIAETFKS